MNLMIFYRIPTSELKQKWIEAIRNANADDYSGSGYICNNHFLPNQIRVHGNNRVQLASDAIPTEFWVDCIEVDDNFHDLNDELKIEIGRQNTIIAKMKIDLINLQKKYDRLTVIKSEQAVEIEFIKNASIRLSQEKMKVEEDLNRFKQSIYVKVSISSRCCYID